MSTTTSTHSQLVSFVVQAKQALADGEALCSQAHALTNASAQTCIDVFVLDAKAKWVSTAVAQQLKALCIRLGCRVNID